MQTYIQNNVMMSLCYVLMHNFNGILPVQVGFKRGY